MNSAGEGADAAMLSCLLCGTRELCDECLRICAAIVGETEGAVIVFSKNLEQTVQRALTIAQGRGDPHALEEHLVLALIDDPDAAAVMRGCSVDLAAAQQRITAAFAERAETPLQAGTDATPSTAFQQIIQRAIIHVQELAREGGQVTGADVLVAAFADQRAAELLQALGFTRYDAVSYLSHGTPGSDQGRTGDEGTRQMPPGSLAEVRLLNDDYTPMEFVVEVIERTFKHDRDAATRLMLETHRLGFGTCGVYPSEAAAAKLTEVLAVAREHQHPLRCVLLPVPA